RSPPAEVDNRGLRDPGSGADYAIQRRRCSAMNADMRPTLIYDGDCGICRYWVDYWRGLTGERIPYRPYQEAAADFPAIAPEACARAVVFVDADGRVYSGAAATFRVLRGIPGRDAWWWLYEHLPG